MKDLNGIIKYYVKILFNELSKHHMIVSVVFATFIFSNFVNPVIADTNIFESKFALSWLLIVGVIGCMIVYSFASTVYLNQRQRLYDSLLTFIVVLDFSTLIRINELFFDSNWGYILRNNKPLFYGLIITPLYGLSLLCYRVFIYRKYMDEMGYDRRTVRRDSTDLEEEAEKKRINAELRAIELKDAIDSAETKEILTQKLVKAKINQDKLLIKIKNEFSSYPYNLDEILNKEKYSHEEIDVQKNYINSRLIPQITWYTHKSEVYQVGYKVLTFLSSVMSGAIPVLSLLVNGVNDNDTTSPLLILIAVLGALGTAISSFLSLHNFRELWIKYKTNCEVLKSTLHRYLTRTGEFERNNDFNTLVFICEQYIVKDFESLGRIYSMNKDEKSE